jgi:hypothetical protein
MRLSARSTFRLQTDMRFDIAGKPALMWNRFS